MSLADLIRGKAKRDSEDVATLTVATTATAAEPAAPSVATVASVTVATPEKRESRHAPASLWLLHFHDLEPVAVTFAPAVDQAGALAAYPTAIAAEPMPAPPAAPIPPDLTAMFNACMWAGLYDDADRAALPTMFAADAEGTRALIEAMHSRIGRCRRCLHFRRPGLSEPGYCTRRDDLRHAYGYLYELADHGGARCDLFAEG